MNADDKRGTMQSIPDGVKRLLSRDQLLTLNQLENFGWRIAFIRRPLFQQPVVVLTSYDGKEMGILDASGDLNTHPGIKFRPVETPEQRQRRPSMG